MSSASPQARTLHLESRIIGRVAGRQPGPNVIVIGGLHGNEPAGIGALNRVVKQLHLSGIQRGHFLAIAGNLSALSVGRRFVHTDLNRGWHPDTGENMPHVDATVEDGERLELLSVLREALDRHAAPSYVLDLHTTSGPGRPFTVFADTLRCRNFALALPSPIILGFEEYLHGTLIDYLAGLGHVAIAFEGGQHDDPDAEVHAEGAIWIALAAAGLIDRGHAGAEVGRRVLRKAGKRLPHSMEIRARHAVAQEDGFRMHPGFATFDRVDRDQLLGVDAHGAVLAPRAGLLLMPLYQEQGEDGFFIVTPFRRSWLTVSGLLRRFRADRVVHWLPGVQRDSHDPSTLVMNTRVAKWFALQLVHLLGFRKVGESPTELRVRRRTHDYT